jgi:hypothetical protein
MGDPKEKPSLEADQVAFLARLVGVELGTERAVALAAQAEPYFAGLETLDGIAHQGAEPAGEFRLDAGQGAGNA